MIYCAFIYLLNLVLNYFIYFVAIMLVTETNQGQIGVSVQQ